ncbi:sialidase isoform X1 [Cinnamomum micranthum f. kanehirae]|uniref:Sialidase isoform X1 n=1 Tax=Cinnamomum micranthum f. kanehirae TaxID=337451 RepID=A0A443NPS8_9MAGN|nr:sialidase isoform X1 [Cinnamomum micranthum f. kanehirae]
MNRVAREALDGGRNAPAGSQHRRGRSLTGISGDRDETLDLFSRNRRSLSITTNDESDVMMRLGRISVGSVKLSKSGMDDLLGSTDGGKHDYDWLLTPPGTPLFSSSDANDPPPMASRSSSSVRSSATTAKASRLSVSHSENSHIARPTRSSSVTRASISTTHYSHSSNRTSVLNTSSASVTSSRPSTPTSRSTLTSSARLSASTARSMPARSATPSKTRPSTSSSSENKTRPSPNPRPSTPTARPHIPASLSSSTARSSSRPSTPTRRNLAPTLTPPARSSSVGRIPPANGRSSAPASRASSPGPRARVPPQPIVLPDFPLDVPPNLRTTLPERPVSAGRSRPGVAVTVRANSETAGPANPPRRQSSSPIVTRGRLPDLSGRTRLHSNGHDVGPPEIQKPVASEAAARRTVKPATSTESTGFGRTISKKSLDMALRHMDIRHSMGNVRALTGTTLFPQSIRSSTPKGRPARVSDAPSPVKRNGFLSENGNIIDPSPDHETSKADKQLTAKVSDIDPYGSSRYDAILLKEDAKNTNWLHSLDDKSDQSPVFDHRFEALPEPFGLL